MICLQLEIDPLSGDIVCASETEAAILHATLGLGDVHLCHFLDRLAAVKYYRGNNIYYIVHYIILNL